MRFVSRILAYSVCVVPEQVEVNSFGGRKVTQPGLEAQFEHVSGGSFRDYELEQALASFKFQGLAHGTKERDRLSLFDSEAAQIENGWSDEQRKLVEDKLLHLLATGKHEGDFIVVKSPALPAPWKTYDEQTPEQILVAARMFGLVDDAIAYEKENLNRAELIAALESEEDGESAAPEADEEEPAVEVETTTEEEDEEELTA